ncbi:MAG: putative oxidoreductase [Verrucomicrobiota bacterium]|jgi:putative oxidoreductase
MNALNRYVDPVYCILRLIIGLMFACHGGQKLLGFPPGGPGGPLDTMALVGSWIELAGGFLIAFGLLTRLAAFIAAGEMAVAYFMIHAGSAPTPHGKIFPIINRGELAVVYCWIFLFIFFYGPGRWSIDALLGRGSAATGAAESSVPRSR